MKTLLGTTVLLINVLRTMPKYTPAKDGLPSTGGFALKLACQSPTISTKIKLKVKVVILSYGCLNSCTTHPMLQLSIGVMDCSFWIKLAAVFPSIPCMEGQAQKRFGAKLLTPVSSDSVDSNLSGTMIPTSVSHRIK